MLISCLKSNAEPLLLKVHNERFRQTRLSNIDKHTVNMQSRLSCPVQTHRNNDETGRCLPGIRERLTTPPHVTSHLTSYHTLLGTSLLNDALPNYMQHIPSRESVNQPANKFLEFYGNSKAHYSFYNSPKPVTILCHMNPTHAVSSYSLKTNYNVTLQSAPRTPQVVYLLQVSQPKP